MMKECPVCHARAFDDAETCFGCMHRFEEHEGAGVASVPKTSAARTAPLVPKRLDELPRRETAEAERGGALSVGTGSKGTLDRNDRSRPAAVISFELDGAVSEGASGNASGLLSVSLDAVPTADGGITWRCSIAPHARSGDGGRTSVWAGDPTQCACLPEREADSSMKADAASVQRRAG